MNVYIYIYMYLLEEKVYLRIRAGSFESSIALAVAREELTDRQTEKERNR